MAKINQNSYCTILLFIASNEQGTKILEKIRSHWKKAKKKGKVWRILILKRHQEHNFAKVSLESKILVVLKFIDNFFDMLKNGPILPVPFRDYPPFNLAFPPAM